MRLLIIAPVHDFSVSAKPAYGPFDPYACDPNSDPNEVIADNLANIAKFVPSATVVLHANEAFTRFDAARFKEMTNVVVNPRRWNFSHGFSQLAIVLSSYLYARNLDIDFDYVTITHSGEMFVKHGVFDYMSQHEFGIWNPPGTLSSLNGWPAYEFVRREPMQEALRTLFDASDMHQYAAGHIEGSFYTRELFDRMYQEFCARFSMITMHSIPVFIEELLLPTFAFHLSRTKTPAHPINAILLHKGHAPLDSMDMVERIRNNEMIPGVWSPSMFKPAIELFDSTHIYTVKRVNRVIDDPVRQAIRMLS